MKKPTRKKSRFLFCGIANLPKECVSYIQGRLQQWKKGTFNF
jgi:hypothetical protein